MRMSSKLLVSLFLFLTFVVVHSGLAVTVGPTDNSVTTIPHGGSGATTSQTALNAFYNTPLGSVAPVIMQPVGGGDETAWGNGLSLVGASSQHPPMIYHTGAVFDNQAFGLANSDYVIYGGVGYGNEFNTMQGGFSGSGLPQLSAYVPAILGNAPGQTAFNANHQAMVVFDQTSYFVQRQSNDDGNAAISLMGSNAQNGGCCNQNSWVFKASALGGGVDTILGCPVDANRDCVKAGGVKTATVTAGGTGYVDGTYHSLAATGGTGTGVVIQTVVVSGGIVTSIKMYGDSLFPVPGGSYVIGDVLSIPNTSLGGTGSGLQLTVNTLYTAGYSNPNALVYIDGAFFSGVGGTAIATNISDLRGWNCTFTGGQAIQTIFGGGDNLLGGCRYEDSTNALSIGGKNGTGFIGGDTFAASQYTTNSFGGGWDAEFGRGSGQSWWGNSVDSNFNTAAYGMPVEEAMVRIGQYGAVSDFNFSLNNMWKQPSSGKKECFRIYSGFAHNNINLQNNICDGLSITQNVRLDMIPPVMVEDFIGKFPIHAEWGRPVVIGSQTSINIGTSAGTIDQANLEVYGNRSIVIPVGTSAARPSSPIVGMMRYNSTTNSFEGYGGASPAWASLGATAAGTDTQVTYNASGAATGNANLTFNYGTNTLAVSNLTVSGTCTGCSGTGVTVLGSSTSATAPQATGDATTGLYSSAAKKLDFSINNTQMVQIGTGYMNLIASALQINGANAINYPSVDSTASGTVAIGSQAFAGIGTTSAAFNGVAVGEQALGGALTTASIKNTAVGFKAGFGNSTGASNTYIGWDAGLINGSGSSNTIVGANASSAGSQSGNTVIGAGATAPAGSNAVAIGLSAQAGQSGFGTNPIAIGVNAGAFDQDITIGGSAGARGRTSGTGNIAIGQASMSAITSGSQNIALGYQVGNVLTTGANNILIGTNSGVSVPTASTTQFLNIANSIYGTGIGTSGTTSTGLVGVGTAAPQSKLDVNGPVKTLGYTVAGLPAGIVGMRAYVTDQLTACVVAGAALTGLGSVICPVFYNGSAWVGD